jgi:hypothetical protein
MFKHIRSSMFMFVEACGCRRKNSWKDKGGIPPGADLDNSLYDDEVEEDDDDEEEILPKGAARGRRAREEEELGGNGEEEEEEDEDEEGLIDYPLTDIDEPMQLRCVLQIANRGTLAFFG